MSTCMQVDVHVHMDVHVHVQVYVHVDASTHEAKVDERSVAAR